MRVEEQNGNAGAGAVALPSELAAAAGAPQIAQLNVSRNSRMHIGPQFVNVTQNVHHDRVVKEAGVCSVAWAWVRATSRGERLACAAALAALALCAVAAGVLAASGAPSPPPDIEADDWNITRELWLAKPRDPDEEPYPPPFLPPRVVIVQHTVGPECTTYKDCSTIMRGLQIQYHNEHNYDLPYNFVIGNDARVYEGRGEHVVGAHTRFYNNCSLGLAFTGNYGEGLTVPTEAQLVRARQLLQEGARAGWLHARPLVLGARDVQDSVSPGDVLYAALRQWPEAPADPSRYFQRPCIDIYAELEALDRAATDSPPAAPPS